MLPPHPWTGPKKSILNRAKKRFEFHSSSKILYCGMNRLRNINLGVFIQCQYTRTNLRKKNMGQSLFKKHSKFLNFDEIFYCGMTSLKNTILNYCRLCLYVKTIKPKKVVRQSLFKGTLMQIWKSPYMFEFI